MNYAMSKPPVAEFLEERQPPPPGVLHGAMWLAFSGLAFAASFFLHPGVVMEPAANVGRLLLLILQSLVYGAALAGATYFLVLQASGGGLRWRAGHWALLAAGLSVVLSVGATLLIRLLQWRIADMQGASPAALIMAAWGAASLLQCAMFLFFSFQQPDGLRWNGPFVVVALSRLVLVVVFGLLTVQLFMGETEMVVITGDEPMSPLLRIVRPIAALVQAAVIPAVVFAAAGDLKDKQEPRDWLHWTGAGVLAALSAVSFLTSVYYFAR